jgi:hypothetical protein
MSHTASSLALVAPNDGSSAHLRDVMTHVLRIHPTSSKASLDDILWDAPKRRQYVERTAIIAVKCADKESGLAV